MVRVAIVLGLLLSGRGPLYAGPICCPCCGSDGACVLKVEPGVEKETCYEVECKEVCIPPVRFPWESCRAPKCGRVRVVARLKEEKREKEVCKYEWLAMCPRCGRPVAKEAAKKTDTAIPPAPAKPKSAARSGADQGVTPPSAPPAGPASGRSSTR